MDTIVLLLVILVIYFMPSIVAKGKEKRNLTGIVLLNLFLGWTFIGWVAALVWAVTVDQPNPHRFR
jgi:Ca2+/Na+ antiporter